MHEPKMIRVINRYPSMDDHALPIIEIELYMPGVGLVDRRRFVTSPIYAKKGGRDIIGYSIQVYRSSGDLFSIEYPNLEMARAGLTAMVGEPIFQWVIPTEEHGTDASSDASSNEGPECTRSESFALIGKVGTIWSRLLGRFRKRSRNGSPSTSPPISDSSELSNRSSARSVG